MRTSQRQPPRFVLPFIAVAAGAIVLASMPHWWPGAATVATPLAGALAGFALLRQVWRPERSQEERVQLLTREHAARIDAERARPVSDPSAHGLRELLAITEAALTQIQLTDLLQHVTERIREIFAVDNVSVVLLSEDRQELVVVTALGLPEGRGLRFPATVGLAARILREWRALVVDDLSQVELAHPLLRDRGVRSIVGVPLRVENRAIGVLHAGMLTPRHFAEDEATLLQLIADRVAIAIDRARLYEQERAAREEAQRAVRAREELLAVVSHDLRNPLSSIALGAAVLRSRLDAECDRAAAIRITELIQRGAERMARLVRDLLDASRLESQGLPIERAWNEPASIVAEAVGAIRQEAERKSVRIEMATSDALAPVLCDRERMLQVLGNLLGNAVKFTAPEGRIRASLEPHDGALVFKIADSGRGIPETALPYVFDRYWRANPNERESSGLGLYIAKGIVEAHGGRMWVESREGTGSAFSFTIPVSRAIDTAGAIAPGTDAAP